MLNIVTVLFSTKRKIFGLTCFKLQQKKLKKENKIKSLNRIPNCELKFSIMNAIELKTQGKKIMLPDTQ